MAERNIQEGLQPHLSSHLETEGLVFSRSADLGAEYFFPIPISIFSYCSKYVRAEQEAAGCSPEFTRSLWDRGFRVSSAARTLDERSRVTRECGIPPFDDGPPFPGGDQTVYQKFKKGSATH